MKAAFVTLCETLSPLVESQLLLPAAYHARQGEATWVALTPIGQLLRNQWRRQIAQIARRIETQFGIVVQIAAIEPSRWKGRVLSEWWTGHQLGRYIKKIAPHLVHARGSRAAIAAIEVRRRQSAACRIVFDCRGDEVAEVLGRVGSDLTRPADWTPATRAIYQQTFDRERRACDADTIIVVSNAMSRMLQERHKVPASRIRVQPCCVDMEQFPPPDRESARHRLGLTNELVVAYLGSLEWYQLPEELLRLFQLIRGLQPDAIFLALTNHPARMRKAIATARIDESACRVLSVTREDVPRLLPAADFGLLLRKSDAVNAVASPVKFGEYLACGVPVVITPGVGDYSTAVAAHRIGVCLSLDSTQSERAVALGSLIEAARHQDRSLTQRCRQYANTHLSWQSRLTLAGASR